LYHQQGNIMSSLKNESISELSTAQTGEAPRVGVYVCHCGLNIAQSVDCDGVAAEAAKLPDVSIAKGIGYACSEPGQREIREDIEEHGLNRIVVASCSPRLHEPTFRQMLQAAGLNPYLLEMANLREQCSWVHMHDRAAATDKAYDLVKMAVARARHLMTLTESKLPMTQRALVIGGGVAGIQAALDLADTGFDVIMVEKQASIGGVMAQLDKTFPTMDCSI
jgi:heterodisulfide reductase subunit A-like polyferredoxin